MMNKAAIALALVAAIAVCVVSANKLPSHHRVHKEHDFEPEHHHLGHSDNDLEEEDNHHQRHRHHGNFNQDHDDDEHRHRHGGIRKHVPIVKPLHSKIHSKNAKRGQLRGVGGAGVGVAGGNFRDQENQSAGFEKNTRLADRKSIQGKKGFVAGEKKGIEGDFQHHADNENSGIHKHQVLNRNKLLIKDQTTGVNDVDGFRNSREESDSGHLAAGESKFVGAGASGKITNDKEFERDVKAGHSSEESSEGAGFVAGAGIGGAGEAF